MRNKLPFQNCPICLSEWRKYTENSELTWSECSDECCPLKWLQGWRSLSDRYVFYLHEGFSNTPGRRFAGWNVDGNVEDVIKWISGKIVRYV